MGLQSKLFRGDPKLEQAALSDPAHIKLGASGPHVHKIQTALMLLDDASISTDEVQASFYGSSTAAAVLAYKRKRNIVNWSYQRQADDIVGKMTMASLDSEVLKKESFPPAPVQIKALSFWYMSYPRSPAHLALLRGSERLAMSIEGPHILPGPMAVLEVPPSGTGSFLVTEGSGGKVKIDNLNIARISDPAEPLAHSGQIFPVSGDAHLFNVIGQNFGRTTITAFKEDDFFRRSSATLDVAVRKPPSSTNFVTVQPHNHTPCRQWDKIQADPNSGLTVTGLVLDVLCKMMSPEDLVTFVKDREFTDKPIARQHLQWYLSAGKGEDFVEDDIIADWLRRDKGIRNRLIDEIFGGILHVPGKTPKPQGHFFFDQSEYAIEDFQFAFGALDRVDYDADLGRDTIHVWFQDRYEWHPVYPGLYTRFPDDDLRQTNCLHAALVELKDQGAADYWMKGEVTVPLSPLMDPPTTPRMK